MKSIKSYYIDTLKVKERDILEVYKYTKFLTAEQMFGGDIPEEEKNKINITGYKLNLKDTNLAVIDIDLKSDMDFIELDFNKFGLKEINEIEYNRITSYGYIDKLKSKNKFLKFFGSLFNTIFVKTPNNGYHFYFENDLSVDQKLDIFGCINYRYIKCNKDDTDIDVFLSDFTNDTFITLPFTKIITEKVDNNGKNIFGEYSSFCYTKENKLLKLSSIYNYLKLLIQPKEYEATEMNLNIKSNFNYARRALDIKDEISKQNLLINMKNLYEELCKSLKELKGYTTGINTFNVISSIVFLPDNMILPVFEIFLDIFVKSNKISINSIAEIPGMFKRCYSKDFKLWSPPYLARMIQIKYKKTVELLPVYFIYNTKESKVKNYGEDNENEIDTVVFNIDDIVSTIQQKLIPYKKN